MDKKGQSWGWLPLQMPGVAKLLDERRAKVGRDWVNTCWRKGVVELQPGWFYAAEGALAVGIPWPDPLISSWLMARFTPTQVLLVLRDPEIADGTH